ncbi:MAG: calcium-binding protein [Hyphomicrobiales bacterium]|nr:calcium-binding protein [Hyphomicrobiales bacterium]
MNKIVEYFTGDPEANPREALFTGAQDETPFLDGPDTAVLQNNGIKIILTGSFLNGINGPFGTVNEYAVFQGTTELVAGKGFDFSINDIKGAAADSNPFKALADLFLDKADKIIGSSLDDTLVSETKGAVALGRDGNDYIAGGAGKQTLKGGDGKDSLAGGKGKDVTKGGKGKDTFIFDDETMKADTIKDFSHKKDTIFLVQDVFDNLGVGILNKKFFNAGKKAEDKNDHIIYNKDNGNLYYDSDGKGGVTQTKIATFDSDAKLKANDFDIGVLV